jgi:hypothetical protein
MDGRPEGELTLRGLYFMVDAPEGLLTPFGLFTLRGLHFMVYGFAGLRFAVDISWFTAEPVYAVRFKRLSIV